MLKSTNFGADGGISGRGKDKCSSNYKQRPGRGPGGNCVCPECGKTLPHESGIPCSTLLCPACNSEMLRE